MLLRGCLLFALLIAACGFQSTIAQDPNKSSKENSPVTTPANAGLTEAVVSTAPMRLRLKNNGFGIGRIVPSSTPSVIGWQNVGFTEPFFFNTSAVRSISTIQAADHKDANEKDLFLIESSDGQSLTGKIVGLDSGSLTIQSKLLGEVKLPTGRVKQIVRADYSGEVIYPGLSQRDAWNPIGQLRDWDIRAGVMTATKQGAAIVGNVKLPNRCEVLLSLGWRGVPDFVISFGVPADEKNSGQVISTARLEVWNRNIVLVRETDKDADLKRLAELGEKNPQIELRIFMDQEKGTVVAQDVHGRVLGSLQVPSKSSKSAPAIHIVNHGPSLTVDRLEVRSWSGSSTIGRNDSHQVVLSDKTLDQSWLSQWNAAENKFIVESSDGSQTEIPIDSVVAGGLRPQLSSETSDAVTQEKSSNADANPETEDDKEIIEVILSDRSRLKGQWQANQNGKLALLSPWCDREMVFPIESALGVIGTENRFSPDLTSHRNGIIKIGDTELTGFLVEEVEGVGAHALRWQPHGSQSSSAVESTIEGNIAYRLQLPVSASGEPTGRVDELVAQPKVDGAEPASKPTPTADGSAANTANQDALAGSQVTREIVFASGDTIDGYVDRADENGVYFRSEQTQVRFVEHSKFDRVWLNSVTASAKRTADEKVKRLMTVPRAQKDDPPTHLLIATSGDLLRGRLLKLTDKSAQFDVRTTITEIPREKIAQIVWLRQQNWNQTTETPKPTDGPYAIHVVQQDRGLTLSPQMVVGGVIQGQSELLGSCNIGIKQISQILFGPRLGERVAKFRENPWILSLAQLPRAYLDQENESDEGTESPLIGKPAPAFRLIQLDGQAVSLTSFEGKVVVLDFWASWCGPCMKSLPAVHELVSSFDSQQVSLLMVNVQETESRASSALERLGLSGSALLDRDGEVSASYQASAIPQTVIIDQQGVVRFVFVGSQQETPAMIKDAIEQLLGKAS
jgi:peroxiredoxin